MAPILEACPHEAARALGARYGLEDAALGVRLEGGYANDLFRLDAGGRAWVLRIERPPIDEESLAWEHAVLGQLCERLPEVCAPVTARNGTTWFGVRDRVAWLMPLVRGAPADPGRTAHRDAAAAALGRIHAVGGELGLAPRPRHEALPRMTWPPLEPVAPLADLAEEIAAARAWAVDPTDREPRWEHQRHNVRAMTELAGG